MIDAPIIRAWGLAQVFGARPIFRDVSLEVAATAPMPTPTPAGVVTARRAALAKVLARLTGMLARYA